MECEEIAKGSVCFRAKQLIQEEKDKAEDLKFEYEKVRDMGFLTGIFCALRTLYLMSSEAAAKDIVCANTSLSEMQSYVLQHGSESDSDVLEWVKTL